MRVMYLGQTSAKEWDRFAVIDCTANEVNKTEAMLDYTGYTYHGFGDGKDGSATYYVPVDDKEDYKNFMSLWKEAKKKV